MEYWFFVSLILGIVMGLWGVWFCSQYLTAIKQGVYDDFCFLFPNASPLPLSSLSCSITSHSFHKKTLFLSIEAVFFSVFGLWWLLEKSLFSALWLSVFFVLIWLVVILDNAYQLIPVTLCQLAWSVGILGVNCGFIPFFTVENSIISSIIGAGFFWAIAIFGKQIFKKEVLGGGDGWLVFALASLLKIEMFPLFLLTSSICGLFFIWRKKTKTIAFAPSLFLGFLIAMLDQNLLNVVITYF